MFFQRVFTIPPNMWLAQNIFPCTINLYGLYYIPDQLHEAIMCVRVRHDDSVRQGLRWHTEHSITQVPARAQLSLYANSQQAMPCVHAGSRRHGCICVTYMTGGNSNRCSLGSGGRTGNIKILLCFPKRKHINIAQEPPCSRAQL